MSGEAGLVERRIVAAAVAAASASDLETAFELNAVVQRRSARDLSWAADHAAFDAASGQLREALAADAAEMVRAHVDLSGPAPAPRSTAERTVEALEPRTFVADRVVLLHVWADPDEARLYHTGVARATQSKLHCMVPSPLHVPLAVLVAHGAALVTVVWLPPLASEAALDLDPVSGTATLVDVLAAGAGLQGAAITVHPGADSRVYVTGVAAAVEGTPALPVGLVAAADGRRFVRLRPEIHDATAEALQAAVVPEATAAVEGVLAAPGGMEAVFDALGGSSIGPAVHAVGLNIGHLGALLPHLTETAQHAVTLELLARTLKRMLRLATAEKSTGDGAVAVKALLERFRNSASFTEGELRTACAEHYGVPDLSVVWGDVEPFGEVLCYRALADLGITEDLDGPPAPLSLPGAGPMPLPQPVRAADLRAPPAFAASLLLRNYATTVAHHGLQSPEAQASFLLCTASTRGDTAAASIVRRAIAPVAPDALLAAAVGEALFGNKSPLLADPAGAEDAVAAANAALEGPPVAADAWWASAQWLGLGHTLLSRLISGGAERTEEEAFAVSECCRLGVAALSDIPRPASATVPAACEKATWAWLASVAAVLRVVYRFPTPEVFGAAADAIFKNVTVHPALAAPVAAANDLFSDTFRSCSAAVEDPAQWAESAFVSAEVRQLARCTAGLAAEADSGAASFPSTFVAVTLASSSAPAEDCCAVARALLAGSPPPDAATTAVLNVVGDGGYVFVASHAVHRGHIAVAPKSLEAAEDGLLRAAHRRRHPELRLFSVADREAAHRAGIELQLAVSSVRLAVNSEPLLRRGIGAEYSAAIAATVAAHNKGLRTLTAKARRASEADLAAKRADAARRMSRSVNPGDKKPPRAIPAPRPSISSPPPKPGLTSPGRSNASGEYSDSTPRGSEASAGDSASPPGVMQLQATVTRYRYADGQLRKHTSFALRPTSPDAREQTNKFASPKLAEGAVPVDATVVSVAASPKDIEDFESTRRRAIKARGRLGAASIRVKQMYDWRQISAKASLLTKQVTFLDMVFAATYAQMVEQEAFMWATTFDPQAEEILARRAIDADEAPYTERHAVEAEHLHGMVPVLDAEAEAHRVLQRAELEARETIPRAVVVADFERWAQRAALEAKYLATVSWAVAEENLARADHAVDEGQCRETAARAEATRLEAYGAAEQAIWKDLGDAVLRVTAEENIQRIEHGLAETQSCEKASRALQVRLEAYGAAEQAIWRRLGDAMCRTWTQEHTALAEIISWAAESAMVAAEAEEARIMREELHPLALREGVAVTWRIFHRQAGELQVVIDQTRHDDAQAEARDAALVEHAKGSCLVHAAEDAFRHGLAHLERIRASTGAASTDIAHLTRWVRAHLWPPLAAHPVDVGRAATTMGRRAPMLMHVASAFHVDPHSPHGLHAPGSVVSARPFGPRGDAPTVAASDHAVSTRAALVERCAVERLSLFVGAVDSLTVRATATALDAAHEALSAMPRTVLLSLHEASCTVAASLLGAADDAVPDASVRRLTAPVASPRALGAAYPADALFRDNIVVWAEAVQRLRIEAAAVEGHLLIASRIALVPWHMARRRFVSEALLKLHAVGLVNLLEGALQERAVFALEIRGRIAAEEMEREAYVAVQLRGQEMHRHAMRLRKVMMAHRRSLLRERRWTSAGVPKAVFDNAATDVPFLS